MVVVDERPGISGYLLGLLAVLTWGIIVGLFIGWVVWG